MKAISIQQPWAWAIVYRGKDIENRNWNTHYRGPIAIHAPAKFQEDYSWPPGELIPEDVVLQLSAVIGVADLIDVVEWSRSKWFEGPFGFVLANSRPLAKPISCKGALTLWTVPPSVLRSIRRQLGKREKDSV